MKKLYALLFILIPCALFAAETYYNFPDATSLPDNSRVLMHDPNITDPRDRNRNITGLKLKQEIAAFANMSTTINITTADQLLTTLNNPVTRALTKKAATDASEYARQIEVKDATGKITYYVQANGTITIGTPLALAVSDVYPANGATGVVISEVPYVTFNKAVLVDISTTYIQGSSTAPVGDSTNPGQTMQTWTIPATLAAGTTYTIKVVKNSILQTDGETTSSCGTAMTDVAGVCESTFTTAP